MAFGLESARTLGALRYSRQNEEEADAEGMCMLLRAQIDPSDMIAVFEFLQRSGAKTPALFQYLSTHPATKDRIARPQSLAAQLPVNPVRLLPAYDWRDIRQICSTLGPPA